MRVVAQPAERVRFDCFEANLDTGELRKHGVRVKLHDQPFQILAMLVARPGEMVIREEIQQKLWPAGTFVDFENGMNRAVNRLREALADSADQPKFIETIPRHGYRFIVPVERLNGQAALVGKVKPEATSAARQSKRWRWLAIGVTAAVLVLAAFGATRLYRPQKAALQFAQRDWVLISSFENRTGNPVLDGTLEYALERELSNSQFVNVVPRQRVEDVLRLMRKSPETKIDAVLGREICLRDGGIRGLLTGRVEKLGTTYVLSVALVDPVRGVTVASLSEEDSADSQMAAAVRRLSNRVRETLGERAAQIQQSEKQLEKVTTPSLHALQLYTQAEELMHREDTQASAAELLKQALLEDPNFASAHLLFGYTFENQGKDAEAKPEFQRAFDLSNSTPDRERFFILASYYEMVKKDKPKASETYEALLRMYPDHFWAANNLAKLYLRGGRWDDSWRLLVHLADLRPDALRPNTVAACGKYLEKDPNGAKPYMERAKAIVAAYPKVPTEDGFVELIPIFYSWSQGDVTKARSQLMQLDRSQWWVDYLWALGELAEAEAKLSLDPDDGSQNMGLGMNAFIKGDLPTARKHFQKETASTFGVQVGGTGTVLLARCGLWDMVERNIRRSPFDSPGIEIVRGERAVSRGQTKEGIALLEKGIEAMRMMPTGAFYLGSETLARTYEKQGNLEAATRVLRQSSDAKGRAYNCLSRGVMSGAFWLRNELQLADLYRKMGRIPEAEKVEDELRKMLIYADADHPIVRALQKRATLSARVSPKP
jgi:DNA-binding winged helix-turn-helix (wHTH) protein/tetratricopeptide (TPR) repeat protein